MLRNKFLYFLLISLFTCQIAQAQTKRRKVKPKKVEVKVETPSPEDLLYEDMLSSTARVLVIDSIVVDKKNFIGSITLSKESGRVDVYDKQADNDGVPQSFSYTNEFGNKMIFSKPGKDGTSRLFIADKLNGKWQNQKAITEFDDEFTDINHPFMMSDGVTLYFSAKSKNGLGEHDIYVTMYDADSARFYKPENIGLPYNSKADELYFIIDEFNSLGWLVTDRNQPAGKVCVYTFVPSSSRDVYDETVEKERLKALADIRSIKDTWTNKSELTAARARLADVLKRRKTTETPSFRFIINDETVYTKLEEFKSAANRVRYRKLCTMQTTAGNMADKLDARRRVYSSADVGQKRQLAGEIKKLETGLETLQRSIHSLEKEIRNDEIKQR